MAVAKVSDLTLGNYLKIVSLGAVHNNLPEASPIWEYIKKKKVGGGEGREIRQLLRSAYGASAVGFVKAGAGAYPSGHQATINETKTDLKDFALTIEVERTLIASAMKDFARYGEPLTEELRCKTIALARLLSGAAYADGTGVIVEALDAGAVDSDDRVTFNCATASSSRGYIGWVEPEDKLVPYNADATTANPTVSSGTFDHYAVISIDRSNGKITLEARNSSGTKLTVTATGLTTGDYLYRSGQETVSSLSSAPTADYNTLSEAFIGLESLCNDDGRKVNNITLSGALKGTRLDAAGSPIDSQHFQELMSKIMIAVGQGRYKYSKAMLAWEALDALVESREVDRRFQSIKDNKRGVESLGYVHGRNTILFEADEFCRKDRIFIPPEGDAIQYHGTDFEFVEPQAGQKFTLRPNSTGHDRVMRAYMEGKGNLVSVHNAAIGCLHNFTV